MPDGGDTHERREKQKRRIRGVVCGIHYTWNQGMVPGYRYRYRRGDTKKPIFNGYYEF
jgi:hypothetical protein